MAALARLLLYLGVLAITPDAALLRWQRSDGASMPLILVWRYLLVSLFLFATALWLHGGIQPLLAGVAAAPRGLLALAAVLQSLTNIFFTLSLILVEPAQALILISLSPVWAALLGRIVLGVSVDARTFATLTVALASVGIIYAPAILGFSDSKAATGPSHSSIPLVDVIPLATGVTMAAFVVVVRHLANSHPHASIPAIPAIGAAISCIGSLGFEVSRGANLLPPLYWNFWPALGLNALAVTAYYGGISSASKKIPPTEVAIAMLGETVLAPAWMFFCYGEVPSVYTIAGGALLLSALAVKELLHAKNSFVEVPLVSRSSRSSIDFHFFPVDAPDNEWCMYL